VGVKRRCVGVKGEWRCSERGVEVSEGKCEWE
jgi:hypothetical protein